MTIHFTASVDEIDDDVLAGRVRRAALDYKQRCDDEFWAILGASNDDSGGTTGERPLDGCDMQADLVDLVRYETLHKATFAALEGVSTYVVQALQNSRTGPLTHEWCDWAIGEIVHAPTLTQLVALDPQVIDAQAAVAADWVECWLDEIDRADADLEVDIDHLMDNAAAIVTAISDPAIDMRRAMWEQLLIELDQMSISFEPPVREILERAALRALSS